MAAAFHWDSFFSGFVLSAFWAGYALTQILGGKLADKYGGNRALFCPGQHFPTLSSNKYVFYF